MLGQRITPGVTNPAHQAEPRSHIYIKQRHCPQSTIALSQFNRAPFSLTYDLFCYYMTIPFCGSYIFHICLGFLVSMPLEVLSCRHIALIMAVV